jgi:hypothetical protein
LPSRTLALLARDRYGRLLAEAEQARLARATRQRTRSPLGPLARLARRLATPKRTAEATR